jgi:hypothetical protein
VAHVTKRSDDPGFFAHGGKTKMFGKGHTGESEAGVSGKASNEAGGGEKYACGGSTKMFGKGHAGLRTPGISGKPDQNG